MSGRSPYLRVDREVEEVVEASVALVDLADQHLLVVLVRDVLDHQRSARVLTIHDLVQVQPEPLLFSTKSLILSL